MRIVGGELKGKTLVAPKDRNVRPTSDRVRESLFNIIAHGIADFELEGAMVADLFAGTGALGIESLSRGAKWCLFVDQSATSRGLIRENTMNLGLNGSSKISRNDARSMGVKRANDEAFDLVFADPPYGQNLGDDALNQFAKNAWLKDGAIIILEEDKRAEIKMDQAFDLIDERKYGDTIIYIYRYHAGS